MPVFTPNFALPYPGPSDRPCDFSEQWCDFVESVETILDGVETTLDRIYPTIKIASIVVSTPTVFAVQVPIVFDTVFIDTARWVNTTTMDRIVPDIGGILTISGTVTLAFKAVAQDTMRIDGGPSSNVDFASHATGLVQPVGMTLVHEVYNMALFNPVTGFLALEFSDTAASTPVTVIRANLTAFWHSDV